MRDNNNWHSRRVILYEVYEVVDITTPFLVICIQFKHKSCDRYSKRQC
jgi:hypothetical protein